MKQGFLQRLSVWSMLTALVAISCGCSHFSQSTASKKNADFTNLKQLGLSIRWATGDRDSTPTSFSELNELLSPVLVKPNLFVCPATGHDPGSLNSIAEWSDYIYMGNMPEG